LRAADEIEIREQSGDERTSDGVVVAHCRRRRLRFHYTQTTELSADHKRNTSCRDTIYATVDKKTQAREVKHAAEADILTQCCES
jgi:hypothetical protein